MDIVGKIEKRNLNRNCFTVYGKNPWDYADAKGYTFFFLSSSSSSSSSSSVYFVLINYQLQLITITVLH